VRSWVRRIMAERLKISRESGEAKNPKSECRNPKQAQNSKAENSKREGPTEAPFEFSAFSAFGFVSDFVLRISDIVAAIRGTFFSAHWLHIYSNCRYDYAASGTAG